MIRRLTLPHPLVLMLGCVAVAAALTWVVPSGQYDRRQDEATGRSVVVPGTFHPVPPEPVGVFQALAAVPRGMVDAASVIFLVFLAGGGFTAVERTGALRRLIDAMARRLAGRGILILPAAGLAFAAAGALMQMSEELVAFAPLLVLLCAAFGVPPLVAVLMSIGAAQIGAMFSPVDPFMVTIAQKVAQVPVGSGWRFRTILLVIATVWWLWTMTRWAMRESTGGALRPGDELADRLTPRHVAILLVVALTFLFFVIGAQQWGWDFDRLATLFLIMGVASGLIGGLRAAGTAEAMLSGARDMVYSALIIGVARGIFVVLDQGHIVDSLVHTIASPLMGQPPAVAAVGMYAAQALIHVPVPSTSGLAVLTMPIMAPVADLVGLSRQVAILAYQLGAGLTDMFTPTNGPLIAMLAACGVSIESLIRWVTPRAIVLAVFSIASILVAIAMGWQ